MSSTKNILTIYTGQDKDDLHYLLHHLHSLQEDFNIAIWSDEAINRGQRWKPQNVLRLGHADVYLLLLSHAFMHSEFIGQDEFKMVLDRYKEGKAIVIPILLDDCTSDVEFTFDDYNFNFGELQVFRKDERQIGEWNPTDKVFMQVAYYIRGLLTSSTKRNALEEPAINGREKKLDTKKEGQIAIDFFDEKEVNSKAERERRRKIEAEGIPRGEKDIQLSDEAVANEVIRKEKRLRQKADIQKRIEKGVEAKRIVQENQRDNEEAKGQMSVVEKRRSEITKSLRGTEREKGPGRVVAVERRVTKKNGLSKYNYQFKTAEEVEAKRVVQEERRDLEEAKAQMPVKEKSRGEITKSQRGPEREKRLGAKVAAEGNVTPKNDLSRYNYQFEAAKVVEAKRVVQEERRGNEKAKIQLAVEERRGEIAKSLRKTEREKRLEEIVSVLKRVLKKNRIALQNSQSKYADAIHQFSKEAKRNINTNKTKGKILAALKRVLKKNRFVIQNSQAKYAVAINQSFKEAKKNLSTIKKSRVRPEFLIAALLIFGIVIYVFTGDSEKQSTEVSKIEEAEADTDAVVNTKTNPENQAGAILKLGIGDMFNDGIIFAIDPSNNTGKIASMDDEGPMTWKNAMTIQEQLGEGWRLPTLDELRLMYKNIGQGADNKGEFADELYWSATPFDDYQARLLRFSDGNASYHFNSSGTFRKFRVRAIRDFTR